MNTGWIDEHVACVREWVANIFFYRKGDTTIMIDAGYNYDRLEEKMGWLGIDPKSIRHILITHQDTDHVGAVESDSPGLFRNAKLYVGEIENRYLTGKVRRKVIYHLYRLPQVTINNPKQLLKDGDTPPHRRYQDPVLPRLRPHMGTHGLPCGRQVPVPRRHALVRRGRRLLSAPFLRCHYYLLWYYERIRLLSGHRLYSPLHWPILPTAVFSPRSHSGLPGMTNITMSGVPCSWTPVCFPGLAVSDRSLLMTAEAHGHPTQLIL